MNEAFCKVFTYIIWDCPMNSSLSRGRTCVQSESPINDSGAGQLTCGVYNNTRF